MTLICRSIDVFNHWRSGHCQMVLVGLSHDLAETILYRFTADFIYGIDYSGDEPRATVMGPVRGKTLNISDECTWNYRLKSVILSDQITRNDGLKSVRFYKVNVHLSGITTALAIRYCCQSPVTNSPCSRIRAIFKYRQLTSNVTWCMMDCCGWQVDN